MPMPYELEREERGGRRGRGREGEGERGSGRGEGGREGEGGRGKEREGGGEERGREGYLSTVHWHSEW